MRIQWKQPKSGLKVYDKRWFEELDTNGVTQPTLLNCIEASFYRDFEMQTSECQNSSQRTLALLTPYIQGIFFFLGYSLID